MNAVNVVFGANSQSFQAELRKMESATIASSRRLNALGGGGGHGAHGGIIRESAVLIREASRGNFTRMMGSLSILIQYLNGAAGAAARAVIPARMLSDAYAEASLRANAAATAAMRKAEASAAAAEAEGFQIDATLAAADADAVEAQAANATALALARKADAALADAVAQEADAEATTASVGAMTVATGIIGGLVATAVLWHTRISMLASRLGGLKAPDFDVQPLARQAHSINEGTEAQKRINDEVQTTIEKYNSAASAAERFSKSIERQAGHAKRMLEIAKETELAQLGKNATPEQKLAVEKKYSDAALANQKAQDQAELDNMNREQYNLVSEARAAKQQADAIKVPSAAEDKQTEARSKGKAEFAQKYLETQSKDPSLWAKTKDQFAAGFNPGTRAAIAEAGKMRAETAHAWIEEYRQTVQTIADNEEIRKRQESLNKRAGESLSKAAQISLELPDKQREFAATEKDAGDESAAKLREEKAKALEDAHPEKGYGLNQQQRIGAYAATTPIMEQQLAVLRSIDSKTSPPASRMQPPTARPPSLG
jgi:hypothetical protein